MLPLIGDGLNFILNALIPIIGNKFTPATYSVDVAKAEGSGMTGETAKVVVLVDFSWVGYLALHDSTATSGIAANLCAR